jgi:hypothetical protein
MAAKEWKQRFFRSQILFIDVFLRQRERHRDNKKKQTYGKRTPAEMRSDCIDSLFTHFGILGLK